MISVPANEKRRPGSEPGLLGHHPCDGGCINPSNVRSANTPWGISSVQHFEFFGKRGFVFDQFSSKFVVSFIFEEPREQ